VSRSLRLAVLAGLVLILLVTGSVVATRQPQVSNRPAAALDDEEEGPPAAEDLAHATERLRANDIAVDDTAFAGLAAEYGVGGAVRVVAWAADPDDEITIESIRALRNGDGTEGSGMGWGRIAKELGVHPGIGSIMGNGGGHGRENAPGQQDRDGADD
jgi:hypothetical protein